MPHGCLFVKYVAGAKDWRQEEPARLDLAHQNQHKHTILPVSTEPCHM